jgi:predicted GNAT superfamily acetyltransferase
MDRTVIARVFAVAELLGARYLASEPTADAPASLRRFYTRLGFVEPRPGLYVASV